MVGAEINILCLLRSMGPGRPTWAGLCDQKLRPVKVNIADDLLEFSFRCMYFKMIVSGKQ